MSPKAAAEKRNVMIAQSLPDETNTAATLVVVRESVAVAWKNNGWVAT